MPDLAPADTALPRLPAQYYGRRSRGYGNVIWSDRRDAPGFRMIRGKFGPKHPCKDNPRPTVFSRADQPVGDDPLGRLRARGYMASCFPEGDGIGFDPPVGKSTAEIVADFEECLGLTITVEHE